MKSLHLFPFLRWCPGLPLVPLFFFGGFPSSFASDPNADLAVIDLRVEYRQNPVGIDNRAPRFSWRLAGDTRNLRQSAHQVQVAESEDGLERENVVWDTGKVDSDQSHHVPYRGPDLDAGKRYVWRVKVWDHHGRVSDWSATARWETGLLRREDWRAEWIEPDIEEDVSDSPPAPMLRKEFAVNGPVRSARAYLTAHGVYEAEINGKRVGNHVLSPGWTSYANRLQVQTYDITDHLKEGDNAIGVWLGDGWFRGYIGFGDQRNFYGEKLALLAQVLITYEDGRTEIVGTDGTWKAATGPILKSDIYKGEYYDTRLEREGWTRPGFDDNGWTGVRVVNHGKEKLIAQQAPPVRKIQELPAREILVTPAGETVVDMGQNMIGWVRLRVRGEAGTKVTLRHAEVLDRDGNVYTANLRRAVQTNTYILKGGGEEIWEPRFTFQGFRYVAVDGYPGELTLEDLTGVVLHSDLEPTGHFHSSDERINQLQHNIVWGQKGNFLEIPTDCPQRDERLGWTGDIQVFAPTANLNMNTAAFLTKWLGDLAADQLDNGSIPHVVPNVLGENATGSAGWADAGLIVPWSMYQSFGDTRVLERQYPGMKAWVDFMTERAAAKGNPYLREGDFTFGDWLSFNSTRSDYPGAFTDKDLISSAFFAHSANLLSEIARVLDKPGEAERYAQLFEKIRDAFQQEYVTPNGRVLSNTQTSYLLALRFNLLPDELRPAAVRHLVEAIRQHGHLTTGFLGTPYLAPVLAANGHADVAYELLLRDRYPSWLYPVTRGATTIWERWDGIKPDGTFQNPGMNSFNHYAYGAIGEWLFTGVAGIQADEPGYRRIRIEPTPGGGLTHARAFVNSPYGKIESSWEIDASGFSLHVEIPPNTTATIVLPGATADAVTESGNGLAEAEGILNHRQEGAGVVLEAGSGRYSFTHALGASAPPAPKIDRTQPIRRSDKIGRLLADRDARRVLEQRIPHLMESAWLSQVMGFPLEVAVGTLPAELQIQETDLREIHRELEALE